MERLNWMGDRSPRGMRQSAGLMINYRYDLARIDANHEALPRHRQARPLVGGEELGG